MIVGSPTVLNLVPFGAMPVVYINETDKGFEKEFLIYNGHAAFSVPVNVTATIRGTKGDHHGVAENATVTSGTNRVKVTITEQMTAVAGPNLYELVFVSTGGMRVGTINFIMMVERSALNAGTVISDSDLAYAEQVIDELGSIAAFGAVLNNKIYKFDTAVQMIADTSLEAGMYAITGGYYAVGDCGGALYRICTSAPAGHYCETLANGLYARLIPSETVTPQMYGAHGDGTADDTLAIKTAFEKGRGTVYFPDGNYKLTQDIVLSDIEKLEVYGNGSKSKILNYGFNLSCKERTTTLSVVDENIIRIHDLTFIGVYGVGDGSSTYRCLELMRGALIEVYGCYIEGYQLGMLIGYSMSTYVHDNQLLNCGDCNHTGIIWSDTHAVDAAGDGIYVHHSLGEYYEGTTIKSMISIVRNKINNDISVASQQYGRCGIVLEYCNCITEVKYNVISGYTRGVHYELDLENGINTVESNYFYNCTSGVLLWNVLGLYNILSNVFSNYGFDASKLTGKYGFEKPTVNSVTRISGACILIAGGLGGKECNIKGNRSICQYSSSSLLLSGIRSGANSKFVKDSVTYYSYGITGEICHNYFDANVPDTIVTTTTTDDFFCYDSNIHDNFISGWGYVRINFRVMNKDCIIRDNTFISRGNNSTLQSWQIGEVPLTYDNAPFYFNHELANQPHTLWFINNTHKLAYSGETLPNYVFRTSHSGDRGVDFFRVIKNRFEETNPSSATTRTMNIAVSVGTYSGRAEISDNDFIGANMSAVAIDGAGTGAFAIKEANRLNGATLKHYCTGMIDGMTLSDQITRAFHPVVGDRIYTYTGHMYYVTGAYAEGTPFTYEQRY